MPKLSTVYCLLSTAYIFDIFPFSWNIAKVK